MKKKIKILIVRSSYNDTSRLYSSACNKLSDFNNISFITKNVSGAFEIPVAISRNIKKFDGFIAIGSIIKGETPNFNFISEAITRGIMNLSITHRKPIGNAVLTCLNKEQAIKRFDKGKEAAEAVISVLDD
ncbi:MAG: 6,7-dimethyl-8-ribityllumazine synthase [Pelagibacterales bacterium MED-G40]|nr:MAG: 6,7-dimethyl-8-ribityllumazine synthase [Candidatus Pelagibacter sp. TMED203]PDH19506.1 MAG: 6,7-dimethyl-8-ribityllumazine synthase [Pelagibacterales bacterium MED-G40]|tara:strand:- start:9328 stop:9720 length:393 start_codon:yes stop_codon:yes gene_type:complete